MIKAGMQRVIKCYPATIWWLSELYYGVPALAQYDDYYDTTSSAHELSGMEKILTSPAASLIIVLIGAAGLFNLVTATKRGQNSDKQYLLAIVSFLIVIAMVWYRFSLWNKRP